METVHIQFMLVGGVSLGGRITEKQHDALLVALYDGEGGTVRVDGDDRHEYLLVVRHIVGLGYDAPPTNVYIRMQINKPEENDV